MPKHPANRSSLILLAALLCALWASAALAQTSALTYQGQLNINGGPANGTYDLQFKLFDALTGGTQVSITNTATNLVVTNGLFTTTLDFGSSAFPGAARWLEISVRPAGGGTYTTLSPRQLMASTPYSVRSLAATSADGLSVACVNCVTSNQIGSLPTGSANYIQNTTTLQASSNFNISGNGLIGNRLGIGTTSPTRKLTVQTAAALGEAGLSHTNGTVEVGTYVNSGGGWLQTHTNHPLFFTTNNLSAQMTLTTAGNIGIGTTTPGQKLYVNGGNAVTRIGVNSDSPTLNAGLGLYQANALKWSVATVGTDGDFQIFEDDAGFNRLVIKGAGATQGNVGIGTTTPGFPLTFPDTIGDKISLWGQSGNHYGFGVRSAKLQIHTPTATDDIVFGHGNSSSDVSLTEIMRIKGNGNVGIGTFSPNFRLQVVDSNGQNGTIQVGANGQLAGNEKKRVLFGVGASVGEEVEHGRLVFDAFRFRFKFGGVEPDSDGGQTLGGASNRWSMVFAANGTIQTSDARLKQNIVSLRYGLRDLLQLRPVTYQWKDRNDGRTHLGLIAQEVEKIIPEAVERSADPEAPLGMNYSNLLPLVIKAIQEQQAALDHKDASLASLKTESAALKEENAALEARLTALEQALQKLLEQNAAKTEPVNSRTNKLEGKQR